MEHLTAGILAHVDSGKTTLSEAMLYKSGKIRTLGRVDHKNAFLDTHQVERARGITVFSKQSSIKLSDKILDFIDTPGHVDFTSETERALQVLDYAVLVINATDGVQSHTQTLWSLLTRYNIPTFVFINKMDLENKGAKNLINELSNKLSGNFVDFSDTDLFEHIAMCDDKLMDYYLKHGKIEKSDIQNLIFDRNIFPCFFGSALKLLGIDEFLDGISAYTKEKVYPKKFGARVYKITWDEQGNRLTHIKLTGGSLKTKAVVFYDDKGGNSWSEKANEIRVYDGQKFKAANEVFAGEICSITGISSTYAGQGLGEEKQVMLPIINPVLSYQILYPMETDVSALISKLRILEQEDPQLHVVINEKLREIHIQLMGAIQLEILSTVIKERFGFDIMFDKGNIVYKESIKEEVIGKGHFEPLRHYAEVHLKLEPLPQGSGLVFDAKLSVDKLDKNFQRLVLTHLEEKAHLGVLTGSEITDMKITLIAGRAHEKHTTGGDFRQATYRAVRQGLMCAKSVLLEPVYDFKIEVPAENVGRAITDIQKMGGTFSDPQTMGELTIITGTVPVSTSMEYKRDIISYTKGKGNFYCSVKGYAPCHNAEEVIAKLSYRPENDVENTPDSVFCSHGSGFIVKWSEVDKFMQIEDETQKKQEDPTKLNRYKIETTGMSMESDKALLEIFEKTYGTIKRDLPQKFAPPKRHDLKEEYKFKASNPLTGPEYILVDGYNIIFAWDNLKEIAKENIDAARVTLMDILSNYSAYKQNKLILVFDAYKVKGNPGSVEDYHGISVVYTKEAETADMYIEKVTHKVARHNRVRVATSDTLEQIIILGHGAVKISAENFKREIDETTELIREYLR